MLTYHLYLLQMYQRYVLYLLFFLENMDMDFNSLKLDNVKKIIYTHTTPEVEVKGDVWDVSKGRGCWESRGLEINCEGPSIQVPRSYLILGATYPQ